MLRLFKNLTKKDYFFMLICIVMIVFQVWLDLKLPDYMSEITRLIETEGSVLKDILKQGGYMLLCAFGSLLSAILVSYLSALMSSRFSMTLRRKIFSKVGNFSQAEIKKFQTSSLITRTTNDVTQMEMLISMGLQMLIKAPIMSVWAVSKILNKSIELSAITGLCVLILLITITTIMIIVIPRFSKVQKLIDKVNGVARENLTGIRVIRAFNAEEYQETRFDNVNKELTNTQLFNQRTFAFMMPIMSFIMSFLSLGIYFIGAGLIEKSLMYDKINMFSDVVVFTSYGMQVIMSFLMLAMIFMIIPRASISAKRINEVLDEDISIKDGNFLGKTEKKGIVEFKNVSFKAEKGETVAFIGSTGSGKSTLINLVPRFYDTTDGEVLVDDVNVKDYKLDALHDKLGYVSQKAFMFDTSIMNNVKYGSKDSKKVSDVSAKEAILIAEAKEFVLKMDDGYDSHIARGGTNVSGGQKQRLSIARAIARNPEIYIFDDSFSALDFKTDATLRENLEVHTKDATILIVAQRIGTIINASKIIVLDKGECIGIGTHKELLKSCEVYREIALSQLSKEELENA